MTSSIVRSWILPHAHGNSVADSTYLSLKNRGMVEISRQNPAYAEQLYRTVQVGLMLLTENPDYAKFFPFTTIEIDAYGNRYEQEVGLRIPEEGKGDKKFVFQFSSSALHGMHTDPALHDFFGALMQIEMDAKRIAHSIAACFDHINGYKETMLKYPGKLVESLDRGRCITRVLRYQQRDSGSTVPDAKIHIDRSFLTIHHWSSHPGLRVFDRNSKPHTVNETSADTVAVFPGKKFAALTRGFHGYGTPHGVLDERRGKDTDDTTDRFAIVSFVHPRPQPDHAAWLHNHRSEIEAYEKSFKF